MRGGDSDRGIGSTMIGASAMPPVPGIMLHRGKWSGGPLSTICNVANRVQCGWIEVHVGAGFKPALAQQTRTMRLVKDPPRCPYSLQRAVIRGGLHRLSTSTNAHRPSSTPPLPAVARLRLFASRRVFHHGLHT